MLISIGTGRSDVDHLDHLYVVREDWGRLYARGWWLLIPSPELQLEMMRWSKKERASRLGGKTTSDITEVGVWELSSTSGSTSSTDMHVSYA